MIVSSRLLVPHKIDAKHGDRFLQADLNGTYPPTALGTSSLPAIRPESIGPGVVFEEREAETHLPLPLDD